MLRRDQAGIGLEDGDLVGGFARVFLVNVLKARRPLVDRDRESAEVGIGHQPDLPARKLEHRALLIGEHDRAGAAADGKTRARRGIDAFDVGGALDILHAAAQHRLDPPNTRP